MSITKIAQLAGVSGATVSRVINENPSVDQELAKRVQQVIEENDFVLKPRRKRQSNSELYTHGAVRVIVFADRSQVNSSEYMTEVLHGIELALRREGLDMLLSYHTSKHSVVSVVKEDKVDGICAICSPRNLDSELVKYIERHPIVYGGTPSPLLTGDSVYADNSEIGKLAFEYLAESQGCKSIFIADDINHPAFVRRTEIIRMLCKDSDVDFDTLNLSQLETENLLSDFNDSTPFAGMLEKLRSSDDRCGLFVPCDCYTPLFYQYLRNQGIEPCRDIEILSCNNERMYLDLLYPKCATIDTCPQIIGSQMVELLKQKLSNRLGPLHNTHLRVIPKLILP